MIVEYHKGMDIKCLYESNTAFKTLSSKLLNNEDKKVLPKSLH